MKLSIHSNSSAKYLQDVNVDNFEMRMKQLKQHVSRNVEKDVEKIKTKIDIMRGNQANVNRPTQSQHEVGKIQRNVSADYKSYKFAYYSDQNTQVFFQNLKKPHQLELDYKTIRLQDKALDYTSINHISKQKPNQKQFMKCKLRMDIWDDIKTIFEQLDVYGQDKVEIKKLFLRLNRLPLDVLEGKAVEIQHIGRGYSLKKVLFQLQNKEYHNTKSVTWFDFEAKLYEFSFNSQRNITHILEQKAKSKIKLGNRNYFFISSDLINQLIKMFKSANKNKFFFMANTRSLLDRLKVSQLITDNYKAKIRPKSHYQNEYTIKNVIQRIKSKAPTYLDIDQFLLYFSAKGFYDYPIDQLEHKESSQSGSDWQSEKQKLTKVRSETNINSPKKKKKKGYYYDYNEDEYYNTNKPRKQQQTIRNRNLRKMLQQKQKKQQQELKKKIKARPIPSSHSKQKYQQFMKQAEIKKQKQAEKLQRIRSEDQKRIEYLKTHTMLLDNHDIDQDWEREFKNVKRVNNFTAKPVPWNLKQPKLQQIQAQKRQRRNKINSQNKTKYESLWSNLPHVADEDRYCEDHLKCKQSQPVSPRLKIKQIPDFESEYMLEQKKLQQVKQQFQPTQFEEFNFHLKPEDRHCQKQKQQTQRTQKTQQSDPYHYRQILNSPQPQIYYTRKYQDMARVNQERAIQRQQKQKQKLREEIQRQIKHDNFARYMRKDLIKIPNTAKICEKEAVEKIKRHSTYWKTIESQHGNYLNGVYNNVLKRPFLYQMQSTNSKEMPTKKINLKKGKQKKKAKPQQANNSF